MNTPTRFESPALPRLPRRRALVPTLLALGLAAALVAPSIARARCMAGSLDAWPPPETPLPTQPMILLEGFGNQQPAVTALADGGRVTLVAPGHRVALKVEAMHAGAFGLSQAVLRAAEPLKPSTPYTLDLRDADGRKVRTTTFMGGETGPIGWTTAASAPAPLALTGAPKVTGQSFRRLGCGPSSHLEVSVPARADAPIAVEVTLRELGAEGAVETYVVPVRDGVLRIGHGMCSGAFRVTGPERRFRAELTVRDAAGDAVAAPATLAFDGVDPTGAFRRVKLR